MVCRQYLQPIGFPRACGDGPLTADTLEGGVRVSPRLRGWTLVANGQTAARRGFPAPAGMDPYPLTGSLVMVGFPRACGDGPCTQ